MSGIRERARAATTAEILRLAREQLVTQGADGMSFRAIARELGMVSSAVYRYFPSRDDLLTALIIESYDHLGAAVEEADASVRRRGDFRARWRAAAHAVRDWAMTNPSEWTLLFGTPVPGYAAPADTVGPASRYTVVLVRILTDMAAAGHGHTATVPPSLRGEVATISAETRDTVRLILRGVPHEIRWGSDELSTLKAAVLERALEIASEKGGTFVIDVSAPDTLIMNRMN